MNYKRKNVGFHLSIKMFLIVLLNVFIAEGCSTTRVVTDYDSADAVNIRKDTTVYHYFWGLKKAADIRPSCDKRFNYLNQVQIKTTFLNTAISFLTLGIVVPLTLSYQCSPPNLSPGKIGN